MDAITKAQCVLAIKKWCTNDGELCAGKLARTVRGDGMVETRWRQRRKWALCTDPT